MTVIIYTYPPDYVMAAISARAAARRGLRPVLAIDAKDPRLVVDGIEVIRTDFPRMRNLNGAEFIAGHLDLMRRLATGEWSFKLDSDTLLLRPDELLAGRSETAVGIGTPLLQGCCYALKVSDIPRLERMVAKLTPKVWMPEDHTIGRMALSAGGVHLQPSGRDATGYRTWLPGRDPAWCATNGVQVLHFPLRGGMDRRAIAREMENFP